ncbi:MAG: putative 7-carboxy-7-deazaguanine synthase QueE [Coprococcus sp.]
MSKYKVVERFVSINGEGAKAGELAVFIRFAGCNLDCSYCDTKWANAVDVPYQEFTAEELYDYIKRTEIKNVTLTGGEPLIVEDIDKLLLSLSLDEELSVEVETNGSVDIAEFKALTDNISYTLDYKLGSSNMEAAMCISNYNYIDKNDAVKFVVGSAADLEKANEIIYTYALCEKTKVFLSPVFGQIEPEEIVDFMIEHNMNDVRLQLQMHKLIWEPDARGV